jgi:hypothetical protein
MKKLKNKQVNGQYYAGHEHKWMQQFLEVVPSPYVKGIAFAIACALIHQYTYKKARKFRLSHSTLKIFGIGRRTLPVYLDFFQQAGLLTYTQTFGCAVEISLKCIPKYSNNIKKNK